MLQAFSCTESLGKLFCVERKKRDNGGKKLEKREEGRVKVNSVGNYRRNDDGAIFVLFNVRKCFCSNMETITSATDNE